MNVDRRREVHIITHSASMAAAYGNDVFVEGITLRPHQKASLDKCIEFEQREFHAVSDSHRIHSQIGIMGDKPGSGKSFVISGLCGGASIPPLVRHDVVVHSEGNLMSTYDLSRKGYIAVATNVLVVPPNLVNQWESHLKMHTDPMKLKWHTIARKKQFDSFVEHVDAEGRMIIGRHDLVMVTTTFYERLTWLLQETHVVVRRIIFDEADGMFGLPDCTPRYNFCWFVTASYRNLTHDSYPPVVRRQTGKGLIHKIFVDLRNRLSTRKLQTLVVRNRDSFVDASFLLPPVVNRVLNCPAIENVDRHIMEYLRAGDIEGALSYIKVDNIGSQREVTQRLVSRYEERMRVIEHIEEKKEREELDSLRCRVSAIQSRIGKDPSTCAICYDTIPDHIIRAVTSCCTQMYCFHCISRWIATSHACPLCKQDCSSSSALMIIKDDHDKTPVKRRNSTKLHNFQDAIRAMSLGEGGTDDNKRHSKVLVCCDNDTTTSMEKISSVLCALNIRFGVLKGTANSIQKELDDFNASRGCSHVLLMDSVHYGAGLNLHNATDVILFHRSENELERQVIGRAQRPGREEALRVTYILYENENEIVK